VLKDQPDSVETLTLLANAHQANGETELALENLSRAVEIKPDDVQHACGWRVSLVSGVSLTMPWYT
jgi:cytochrome c-type biogenesis protein CcmH/NrfG